MTVALTTAFAFMGAYMGTVFLLRIYLQDARGLGPLETGVTFLPLTLTVGLMNVAAARAVRRHGCRNVIASALLLASSGLAGLAVGVENAPVAGIALLMMPAGLGIALGMPAVTALLLDSTPTEQAGTASGILNTSRQVGGALTIAAFGSLVGVTGFDGGLRLGLGGAAAFLLVGTVLTMSLRDSASTD